MRWLGNYLLEWLRGPWPEMYFIRHGHGFHQIGYEIQDQGMASSPAEALGVDIPNHLVPLSPLGRWQSTQTKKLLMINPDCIYVSQIRRAIETAQLLFPSYPLRIDPRLNEKEFGPTHMMSEAELFKHFPLHMQRYHTDGKYFAAKGPGGENYIDMFIRLHSILDTLRRDWAGKRVVIVCHSAVMLTFRQLFEHHDPDTLLELGKKEWIENCGILHYRLAAGLWGWQRGKFRVVLAQSPYHLWQLTSSKKEMLWQQAIDELPKLRSTFKPI